MHIQEPCTGLDTIEHIKRTGEASNKPMRQIMQKTYTCSIYMCYMKKFSSTKVSTSVPYVQ